MKHFYKLLLIFFLVTAGKAQVNLYFNNNPCWTVQSMCQIGQNCYTVTVYNYFINGDSLISGKLYKQVWTKGYSYAQYFGSGPPPTGNPCLSPPPTNYYSAKLSFFIRSAAKKMYVLGAPFIPGGSGCSNDTLLYDFNLNIGDILPKTCSNPWTTSFNFTVTAKDSVNTLNGWMKRFKLNNNSNYDYIEGMGYANGLVELMPPNVLSCGWGLQCYSQNTTGYYPSSGGSCLLLTSASENRMPVQKLAIYPNPSSGLYKLYFVESGTKIEVRTITGQLIQSHLPQGETFEIDLSKESAGVYILNSIDKNGTIRSVKLIKE